MAESVIKSGICVMVVLASVITMPANAKQLSEQEKNLGRLMELLVGEFNNYNQVNFQTNDFLEKPQNTDYSRLHQTRVRVESPDLDGEWLFAQINRNDRGGEIYRQTFSHFYLDKNQKIVSKVYALTGAGKNKFEIGQRFLNDLKPDQLSAKLPQGCETTWHRKLDQFVGLTDSKTCVIDSKYKDEKRHIFSEDIVGERGFWAREGAYTVDGKLAFGLEPPNYFRYHRARPMSCWVAVHLGDDEWEFYRDLKTHDEGGSIEFGEAKQYRLQLKQTEFIASSWDDVFELFLYRDGQEKAFAYTWTEPTAKHLAVNLREVQASCKVVDE